MHKILVIDDEKELLEEIVDNLVFNGYDAVGVQDSYQVLNAVKAYKPDLIICDVMMPGLDGYQVLLEIRSRPSGAHIPFIFLTAKAEHDAMRYGMGIGANDYLTKPFTFKELLEAVQARMKYHNHVRAAYMQEIEMLEKQVSEEQNKQHMQSNFLSMVAHDLRTPLTVILSSTQLVLNYKDKLSDDRKTKHLARIEETVISMMQIVDNLTWLSKMESQGPHLTYSDVNVHDLCLKLVEWFQPAEEQTHDIHIHCKTADYTTYADLGLLRQALTNLLSNALKYSAPHSKVVVTLSRVGDDLQIEVHDQGIGIPEQDKARLFQAFQRASNVLDIQGTGVGLTVVKLAAELHQGSVDFQSTADTGTTFFFRIPILTVPVQQGQ